MIRVRPDANAFEEVSCTIGFTAIDDKEVPKREADPRNDPHRDEDDTSEVPQLLPLVFQIVTIVPLEWFLKEDARY